MKRYKYFERLSQNDFSYWHDKVKNCGISIPETKVFKVADDEFYRHMYMENGEADYAYFFNYMKNNVWDHVKGMGHLFIKNARFSNKFNAADCMPGIGLRSLTEAIININYEALCLDANGVNEIIVRKRISYNRKNTPTIYNGLPLRPEFRVFYDYDERKVLYSKNYWDFNYVFPHLYDATDKIIFEHEKGRIDQEYQSRKNEVEKLVSDAMSGVAGLDGAWSIDVMLDDNGSYWLIDMATAESSAYWEDGEHE